MQSDSPIPELDDAMYAFSQADYDRASEMLSAILNADPEHFDALMALGMTHSRLGDHNKAIELGHRAEKLRPNDPLVHTNLSLFYVKIGDKEKAEHHGLQAKITSWKSDMKPPGTSDTSEAEPSELPMANPKPAGYKTPSKFPDMPWKKKD